MSYSLNVPQSGQTLGNTQGPILTNFAVLNTSNNVNHEAFNSANQGKHKFLQMPEQAGSIGQVVPPLPPTTAANEGGLYTKVGTNPAETNLVFRAESDGFEYQMTHVIAASTATFSTNTAYVANHTGGWTFLPGGLIMQYGRRSSVSGSSSGAITFPIPFPSGNAPFSITATLERTSGRPVSIDSAVVITSTGFSYRLDSTGSVAIQWIAIGN